MSDRHREAFKNHMRSLLVKGYSIEDIEEGLRERTAREEAQPGPFASGYRMPEGVPQKLAAPSPADQSAIDAEAHEGRLNATKPTLGTRLLAGITGKDPREVALQFDDLQDPQKNPSTAGMLKTSNDLTRAGRMIGALPLGMGVGGAVAAASARGGQLAGALYGGAAASLATNIGTGKDAGQVIQDAGDDAMLSAGVSKGGEAVSGLMRKNKWIGQRADAADAGRLDAAKALPKGEEGLQAVSEAARDKAEAHIKGTVKQGQREYAASVDPSLGSAADPSPARTALMELSLKNRSLSSGAPLSGVQDRIKQVMGQIGDAPTVDDMLQIRRSIKKAADFKNPNPTEEQLAAREIYAAIKKSIPETKAADAAFAGVKKKAARQRDIIFRTDGEVSAGGTTRVAKEQAGARNLGRVGDTDKPGLAMKAQLDELAEDPVMREIMQEILDKKALDMTRPGMPKGATGLSGAVMWPVRATAQNARPVGYATERLASAAADPRISPATANALRAREQEKERARRYKAHYHGEK